MSHWGGPSLNRIRRGPICPECGDVMFPMDDHGRFTCLCNLGGGIDTVTGLQIHTQKIPQEDTPKPSDEEKAPEDK